MWGRITEIIMALWLASSPFFFGHYPEDRLLWMSDFISAGAILLFSFMSYYEPLRRAHLMNLVLALWLILFGYFQGGHPAAPGYQNEIFIGLTLLLIAIIPNHANQPPRDWQRVYQEMGEGESGRLAGEGRLGSKLLIMDSISWASPPNDISSRSC